MISINRYDHAFSPFLLSAKKEIGVPKSGSKISFKNIKRNCFKISNENREEFLEVH